MNGQPSPPLPVVFRPRRGRVVPYTLGAVLLVTVVVVAVLLPPSVRSAFTPAQVLTLAVLLALLLAALHLVAHVRVVADDEGLTVVNLLRTRRLAWGEVVDVVLRQGDPWISLDLSDGETLPAMGLQAADGERGRRDAVVLRALVRSRA